jgi:UDP:flavonoid glycosyltransferase YjiC (YdhE family)
MQRFLFTTLPSNDLGLLARSLPVASELTKRGHEVAFCSPAETPSRLVAEAGFDNLLPKHPVYYLMAGELSIRRNPRITRRSVVLTKVQVRSDARDRLQPPDILLSVFVLTLESANEAIYSQDNYLRFRQAVCFAERVDLFVG